MLENDFRYKKLKQKIITELQNGNYESGDKFASEPELCKKYMLSRSTVRQAIRELVNAGYLYQMRGRGTFIRAVKPNFSQKIALIIYDTAYLTNPVTSNLLRGIDYELQKQGYALDILASKRDFIEETLFRLPDIYAGFLIGAYRINPHVIGELENSGRPFLFVKNYLSTYSDLAVRIDYVKAGFLATECLIASGCRNIGLIFPGDEILIARDFGLGVRQACLENGAALKQKHCWQVDFLDNLTEIFPDVLKNLPDGIVCSTDEQAIELCIALQQHGANVPMDVQVIGCNNTVPAPRDLPALTTVEIPTFELGQVASKRLLRLIHGQDLPALLPLEPHLVYRESTLKIS